MSDSVNKAYVDSLITTASAGITLNNAGVIVSSGSSFYSNMLSEKEILELRDLEREYQIVIKNKRINIFKSMPSNLRQRIVDDLMCKKFLNDMRYLQEDGPEWSRLHHLRNMNMGNVHISSGFSSSMYIGSNYEAFLEYLSEEEIFNAHAEQSLEESLLNAKTN